MYPDIGPSPPDVSKAASHRPRRGQAEGPEWGQLEAIWAPRRGERTGKMLGQSDQRQWSKGTGNA
jgi:hypothetical protein